MELDLPEAGIDPEAAGHLAEALEKNTVRVVFSSYYLFNIVFQFRH